ncbi:hypothetical protein SteCoe_10766 [Stentor coeruleus]|uniref:Coiled-coil domain-containing protein 34 n=1 Tax=Stentor coeruleus TaxID=5963 RepID=A0A1R2CES7_9CILI|nr:hypothetical protein SteCoe_10766 [Stentor coeruleus]
MNMSKCTSIRSVDRIVCRVDLQKAEAPLSKLANDEYFRALKTHKNLNKKSEEYLPSEVIYMIDKEIRMKSRRDHESTYKDQTENLMSCSEADTRKKPTLNDKATFKKWVKKKNFESRFKKALMMQALKRKYENDLLEEQDREEKKSENRKRMNEWENQKLYEIAKKQYDIKVQKSIQEQEKESKRKYAEEHYREWLKRNMVKLKEEKKQRKIQQQKEIEEKKKKEEQEMLLKQKTEENFKKWLKSKKVKGQKKSLVVQKPIKVKKPIMLAYSPNRKIKKDKHSFHGDLSSFNDTPASSTVSDREYVRKISSKPNLYGNFVDLSDEKDKDKHLDEYSEDFDNPDDEDDDDEGQESEDEISDEYEDEDSEGQNEYSSGSYEKKVGNLSF